QISRALDLSLDGAKYHVSEILARLGVDTREQAVELWHETNGAAGRFRRRLTGLIGAPAFAAAGVAALVAVAITALLAWQQLADSLQQGQQPSPTAHPTIAPAKGPAANWEWSWAEPNARVWLSAKDDVVAVSVSGPPASEYTPHPGAIVLLDASTGAERWRFDTPARAYPALILPELVIAGTADGTLYAVDRVTGAERWRLSLIDTPFHVMDAGDLVLVNSGDPSTFGVSGLADPIRNRATTHLIDPSSGDLVWGETGGPFEGHAAAVGEYVFIERVRRPFTETAAFDRATGDALWQVPVGQLSAPPEVVGDEVWLFTVRGEVVVVSLTDGTEIRRHDMPGWLPVIESAPLHGGIVLNTGSSFEHWAFDGTLNWNVNFGECLSPGLPTQLVGESGGSLFALVCGIVYYLTPTPDPAAATTWIAPPRAITSAVTLPESVVIATAPGGQAPTLVQSLATR
ncbi:MAG TPA: PQQ-binding-like beta-propeller repeat protein, partial [Tepidiformaceae bacterium]|nr:PQQ-binding-like beta-propeller repeat protein [Tepidiformaceae bacterium]